MIVVVTGGRRGGSPRLAMLGGVAGPVLSIELPEQLSDTALGDLRRLLSRLSPRFEETGVGQYDILVCNVHLGIGEDETPEAHRPFLVSRHRTLE